MNKTKGMRIEKKNRRLKRDLRSLANDGVCLTTPKAGVRPLSILHPGHPIRVFGRGSEQYKQRDRAAWE